MNQSFYDRWNGRSIPCDGQTYSVFVDRNTDTLYAGETFQETAPTPAVQSPITGKTAGTYVSPITQTVTDTNGDPVILNGLYAMSDSNVTIGRVPYIADTLQGASVTRRIAKKVFDGNEAWALSGESTSTYQGYIIHNAVTGAKEMNIFPLCNIFTGSFSAIPNTVCQRDTANYSLLFRVGTGIAPNKTLLEWKTYLSNMYTANTPVTVYYVLETPTTEAVTLSSATLTANSPTTTWLSEAYSTFEIPVTGQGNVTLPTSNWPVPIENVGTLVTEGEHTGKYAVPVKVSGKNLIPFQYANGSGYRHGIEYTVNDDGGITANGTVLPSDDDVFHFTLALHVKAGTYFLSGVENGSEDTYRIIAYKTDWTLLGHDIGNGLQITLDEDSDLRIYLWIKRNTTINKTFYPQLERGSTATEYEPYHEPVTTILYLDEPLRKGDTLEVVGGTLTKRSALLDLGSLNWTMPMDYFRATVSNTMKPYCSGFCEFFPVKSTALNANPNKTLVIDGDSRVFMRDPDYANAEEFKAAMSGVILEYELETPTTIDIAGQTIPTFEDTTIITVDTEPEPETMTATYWQED